MSNTKPEGKKMETYKTSRQMTEIEKDLLSLIVIVFLDDVSNITKTFHSEAYPIDFDLYDEPFEELRKVYIRFITEYNRMRDNLRKVVGVYANILDHKSDEAAKIRNCNDQLLAFKDSIIRFFEINKNLLCME